MTNIIFGPEYEMLPKILAEQRIRAKLSQRALAKRMNRSNVHVYRIEKRLARIELVEFCKYVQACGGDPVSVLADVLNRIGGSIGNSGRIASGARKD